MFLIFRITAVLIEATTLLPSSPSDNENSTRTEMITEAAEESTFFFTEDLDISSTMKIDMIESDNNTNVESTTLIEEETSLAEEASESGVEIKSIDEIPTTFSPRSEIIDPTTMQSEIFDEAALTAKKQETTMSSMASADVETSTFAASSRATDSSITGMIMKLKP